MERAQEDEDYEEDDNDNNVEDDNDNNEEDDISDECRQESLRRACLVWQVPLSLNMRQELS